MHEFVPPFPERPRQPLSAFATLRLARCNFLAIWEDRCFEWEVFSTRLLSRTLFVCNSPDTVASAFVEHHDSFERKSPQMRHSLAPLLGDGLFISGGASWRRSSMCRIWDCSLRLWSRPPPRLPNGGLVCLVKRRSMR